MLQHGQEFRARERAKDLDAYRANSLAQKKAWEAKDRDRVKESQQRTRDKALSLKLFYCEVCDMSLQSQLTLNKHLKTTVHADHVNGVVRPPMSQKAINMKISRAKAEMDSVHRCTQCN
jgi:hypothetical protein